MKHALAALALAALVQPVIAQVPAMPSSETIRQILVDRIDRDQANIGITVAVIEDGVARFVSHGTLAADDATPVDEHTVFEAGSITKVMTNLLLARLVAEGRIDLDAPIADYLPEGIVLPERDGQAITAFDLATHSAGLSGLPPELMARGLDNPYSGYGAEELLDWLADYQLPRAIGSAFEYSNVGTALLGLAIEHVSGRPYAELLQEQVLEPLEMTETSLALTPGDAPEGMATGHDAAVEPVGNWDMEVFAPVGALLSTTSDLAKFIAAASGTAPPDLEAAFALMLERTRLAGGEGSSIGLGWFILEGPGSSIVWHNGITAGFRSFVGFDRQTGKGVVLLSNMVTGAGIEDIALHLLDPGLPLREQPTPRQSVEIDPSILPGYAGDYVLAPGVVLSVSHEDGKLFAQLTGQPRYQIFPESETRFFYKIVDAQITFSDQPGTPMLVLHQNGQNMTAPRVP